ncbi:unnamed protein product [Brassica oleracea]|uniref:(rape) hypothetical protein n=1 Tax=Brassica napus TaxID=3708 RepID=A0A816K3A0_BRANA|nr:unnamed protein product [Brassica napus]
MTRFLLELITLEKQDENSKGKNLTRRRRFSHSRRGSSTYRRYSLSPHLLTESSVSVARVTMRFSLSRRGSTGIGRFNSVLRWLSSTADGALCLSVALLDC